MSEPLIKLTHKNAEVQEEWGELISAPILVHPDVNKPFELVSDVSLIGTGAVLLQEGKVVAFTSKKFSKAEKNYTATQQEMLGVVRALHEWRCYFTGDAKSLTLVTDHKPLTYIETNKTLSRRSKKWVEFMGMFNYTWLYRKGADNVAEEG